jgi:serine protease Do
MRKKFLVTAIVVSALALAGYLAVDGAGLVYSIAYAAAKDAATKASNDAARAELAELSKQDHTSALFVQVAKVLRPAVVEVKVTKRIKMTTPDMPDMNDFMRRFFGDESQAQPSTPRPNMPRPRQQSREFTQRGLGSGVIVDAANGYVLTNYHVVAGADETIVVLPDGKTLKTTWIRTDRQTDLAILKVEAKGLIEAPLGDSDAMQVGDQVLAIGSPEGLEQTVTSGIISAMKRSTGQANTYQSFIQTDAAINHGNSGGPLVNMKGEVIGINTAIVSQTGVNEGIGLAIPSNMVKTVMRQLIDKGKVTRGYLGVGIQNVTEDLAKSFKLPGTHGAIVTQVVPEGPAGKAGMKKGDFITAVDGKEVVNVQELRRMIADIQPGLEAEFTLFRGGDEMKIKAKIEAQPADINADTSTEGDMDSGSITSKFGLELTTMTPELAKQYNFKHEVKGAMITSVANGSDAESQGLRPGMVITDVDGKDIASADDFVKVVDAKASTDGIRIGLTDRNGNSQFAFIKPRSQDKPEKSDQDQDQNKDE